MKPCLSYVELLLGEPQVTHGCWRAPNSLVFALEELIDLSRVDADRANKLAGTLYERLKTAYRQHFGAEFDPLQPPPPLRKLLSMYLPRYCHSAHAALRRMQLA